MKLTEPADYSLEHPAGVVWDVFAGTHRLHYSCKHVDLHVVTWSDWNDPVTMDAEHPNGIPEHPQCPHPFDNCGHLELVAGCHERHSHHPDHQPQRLPIRAGLASLRALGRPQEAGGDGGDG